VAPKNSKPIPNYQYIILKPDTEIRPIFFFNLSCQISLIMLTIGTKYSTCDLNSDVNYCSLAVFVRYIGYVMELT